MNAFRHSARPFAAKLIPAFVAFVLSARLALAADATPDRLADMSLESLLGSTVTVSSVARRPGSLQQSPAAVTIITQEDVRRSGATSIPDLLRLGEHRDTFDRVARAQATISSRLLNYAKKVKRATGTDAP